MIIGGNMSVQIGKDGNDKFSLHNLPNRIGKYLAENSLVSLKTNFQKREGKLWTYTNSNNSKAQLDNKKWINSALNCEAYSSFEGISFDDRFA